MIAQLGVWRAKLFPRRGSMQRRESIEGWVFASPWILGFLLWTLGPMLASAYFSFTKWDLLTTPKWVGLGNYVQIFMNDPRTLNSLKVTTIFAGVSVPLRIVLGLAVAMLLNSNVSGMQWYRTIYYLPAVLSGVAVSLLWMWVFSPEFGLLNLVLGLVGISGPAWLADEHWALSALTLMSLWGIGGGMIIYLAGLQGVPTEYYDAAKVDGAGAWLRFLHVTLPMISPVLFFELIMGIIHSLQTFVQAYMMTGGGPHDATMFFILHLYNHAFSFFEMGYASAMAWILLFYIMALTLFVFRGSKAWVFYQGTLRGRG